MSETAITLEQSNDSRNDAASLNWIQFNLDYFKTNDGILKVIQMVSIVLMRLVTCLIAAPLLNFADLDAVSKKMLRI